MKQPIFTLALTLFTALAIFPQTPAGFEVATIKVHSFASDSPSVPPISGNRFTRTGNINQFIIEAYDLKVYQVAGGPAWVQHPATDGDYYDVNAIAPGPDTLTQPRARQLLQTLLTDRFHLKFHRETKEMPAYALTVGKGGPRFKESAAESAARMNRSTTPSTIAATFTRSTMGDLLRVLSGAAGRPVLDQTGLAGMYDFKLEFARDPAAAFAESGASSVFTALQEQLGLKLESRKEPIEILVIDNVDRPSEN